MGVSPKSNFGGSNLNSTLPPAFREFHLMHGHGVIMPRRAHVLSIGIECLILRGPSGQIHPAVHPADSLKAQGFVKMNGPPVPGQHLQENPLQSQGRKAVIQKPIHGRPAQAPIDHRPVQNNAHLGGAANAGDVFQAHVARRPATFQNGKVSIPAALGFPAVPIPHRVLVF